MGAAAPSTDSPLSVWPCPVNEEEGAGPCASFHSPRSEMRDMGTGTAARPSPIRYDFGPDPYAPFRVDGK